MKMKASAIAAVIATLGISAAGVPSVSAQTSKRAAYYISEFQVTDREGKRWSRLSEQIVRVYKWSLCRG